jgi:hypothetical protein
MRLESLEAIMLEASRHPSFIVFKPQEDRRQRADDRGRKVEASDQ